MPFLPGSPHPLGATWDGDGVNFALYSENAADRGRDPRIQGNGEAAAPRRARGHLGDVWGDERVRVPHAGTYRNVFTGEPLRVAGKARLADVFADFPVALLLREGPEVER
jgi:hypothetical protein